MPSNCCSFWLSQLLSNKPRPEKVPPTFQIIWYLMANNWLLLEAAPLASPRFVVQSFSFSAEAKMRQFFPWMQLVRMLIIVFMIKYFVIISKENPDGPYIRSRIQDLVLQICSILGMTSNRDPSWLSAMIPSFKIYIWIYCNAQKLIQIVVSRNSMATTKKSFKPYRDQYCIDWDCSEPIKIWSKCEEWKRYTSSAHYFRLEEWKHMRLKPVQNLMYDF